MDIFRTLEFTQKWIDLGIIAPEKLVELETEWNKGEDNNPEHYRWRAFRDFMNSKEYLGAKILRELYDLGKNDADSLMGGVMMVDVLSRKDCPPDLLESALNSEEKFLRKAASRKLGKEFVP